MAFETIRSASGVDFIGTDEVDVLVAFNESGNIFANGRKANDSITFNQIVTGVLSTTTAYGGEGTDTITVNSAVANSTLNGNKGTDTLTAGNLAQSFFDGGADADTLNARGGAANSTVRGSKGNDTLNLDGSFSSSVINGNENNDIVNLTGVAAATGTATSSYTDTVVYGGADNDTIQDAIGPTGRAINFTNATINGNKGLDVINLVGGPAGSITASGLTIFGGEGTDTINASGVYQVGSTTAFAALYVSGDLGNDNIVSGGGADTVMGGEGNDTVNAGAGNDTIMGGEGDDAINAGGGTDRVIGGNGADTYAASAGTKTFVIEEITNSQATVSGTTQGFDTFAAAGSFVSGTDKLNISAVASSLAGGTVNTVNAVGADIAIVATSWSAVKTALDAAPGVLASSTAGINARTFSIAAGALAGNYLWINDTQAAYNQGDLVFKINATNQIAAGDIVIA